MQEVVFRRISHTVLRHAILKLLFDRNNAGRWFAWAVFRLPVRCQGPVHQLRAAMESVNINPANERILVASGKVAEVIMAKAEVDPAELRRFARDLNRFNCELDALMVGLQLRLRSLEKTWHDQEQRKFTEEFNRTIKSLGRFLDSSGQHVSFLVKKARYIEDYLQQR